jgi:epoxyqueuosine reductase
MTLAQDIRAHACALGFDLAGIVSAGPPLRYPAFAAWLAAGYHGEMVYLAARATERADPAALAPGARSMVVLAANYNSGPPPPAWNVPSSGRIARYAWTPDYHDVIKPRLYELDRFIRERTGRQSPGKACVDTAPLLERDFAEQSGLGFIGKNTCLITPGLGSWTFLAALVVPETLTPDIAHPPSFIGCGGCTRCLDACPTQAFVAPYVLDARRCISYLTIELRGPIPRELRPLMGNWVFGCDVCQEVCPYNKGLRISMPALKSDPARAAPPLLELLVLNETGFRRMFHGTPVLRAKRRGLVRNACVAVGNWGDPAAVPVLIPLLADPETLVRGHAAWALGRIGKEVGEAAHFAARALDRALASEPNAGIREEITLARAEMSM